MKRELTDRQIELSIGLRELVKMPETPEAWTAMTDLVRAFAIVLDGVENMAHPREEHKAFQSAWRIYSLRLWKGEQNRIIRDCLGKEYERVVNHPDGQNVVRKILSRVAEINGGLRPGLNVDDVEIGDILYELGEDEAEI